MRWSTKILVTAALVGCGSKPAPKKPVEQPPPAKPAAEAAAQEAPAPTPVSPSLAVSADLASLCSLSRREGVPPTFDYDKIELSVEDREVLQQLAACLASGPGKDRSLSLTGRADPRGTEEYNLGLGARRANAVAVYLQRLGVPPDRLVETTRGAIDAVGTDEEGWRRDRRVDLDLR
jgi:peptidoglycan-associated lipoprotein